MVIALIASIGIGYSAFYIIAHKDDLLNDDSPKLTVLTSRELDSDGDGLSDFDEREKGTDPYNIDTDGDGYSDNQEIAGGYDPLALEGAETRDSDLDGLNDEEEKRFGTSPFLADSDFDGKEDGAEVIAGTDPSQADLAYFLDISESKAQSDAILNTLNTNTEQLQQIAEQSGVDSIDQLQSFGGDEALLSPFESLDDLGIDASSLGAGDASEFKLDANVVSALENTVSSGDLSSLQQNFSSFVQDSSLQIDPLSTIQPVELPPVATEELTIIDEYSKEDVERYFAVIALILSKDVPFTNAESFERFAVNLRLENKNDMARVKKILTTVERELISVEVPNDERIINLHKKSISFIRASIGLVVEIENIDFNGGNSLTEVTSVLPRVNYLSNVVFSAQILPEIRNIIEDYELQSLIQTLELAN